MIEFFLFVFLGCVVGFLAGLFGVGGGFLMVPVLVFSYEYSGLSPSVLTHTAIGTSLFVVVFSSFTSAYQHSQQKNVDWRSVFALGLSSVLTAFVTTRLAAALSGRHLRMAFALIVMAAAIRMVTEGEKTAQKRLTMSSRPSTVGLVTLGLTTGVVSALAGIGGGVFTVPMMYYLLNMPIKLAIGTSSAAVVITGFSSLIGYIFNGMGRPGLPAWSLGFVDLERGAALTIGTILLARFGAKVSFKTHPFRLRKCFGFFIIFISLYMLFK